MSHRINKVPMSDGLGALVCHMDEQDRDGWEVFHVHESVLAGIPCFLVFSRRKVVDDEIERLRDTLRWIVETAKAWGGTSGDGHQRCIEAAVDALVRTPRGSMSLRKPPDSRHPFQEGSRVLYAGEDGLIEAVLHRGNDGVLRAVAASHDRSRVPTAESGAEVTPPRSPGSKPG